MNGWHLLFQALSIPRQANNQCCFPPDHIFSFETDWSIEDEEEALHFTIDSLLNRPEAETRFSNRENALDILSFLFNNIMFLF
jgi:hypothetical protein